MDSLKAAILGTQHPDVTVAEREILLAAGAEGFRQIVGYIPPTMPIDEPTLPPLEKPYSELSDAYTRFIGGKLMPNRKPRVVYIVLIWLLIDSSNPYRLKKCLVDDLHFRQLAAILMWIAVGGIPFRPHNSHTSLKQILWDNFDPKNGCEGWVYGLALSLLQAITSSELLQNAYLAILHSTANKNGLSATMSYDMKVMLVERIEHWQGLADKDLLQIMTVLMRDILPPKHNTT